MESSCQDLSNDVAEHRSTLKNNQNTYYTRFGFIPKTGIAFPKTSVLFLLRTQPKFFRPKYFSVKPVFTRKKTLESWFGGFL